MNTYYSYRSYRLGGRLLGTLGCGLAWAFFGSGWWSFLLGALLLFLWLPVILGRPDVYKRQVQHSAHNESDNQS